MAENPYLDVDRQMVGDIYTSAETARNLVALCDELGGRFAGSDEEIRAANFIAGKLAEYGLPVVVKEPVAYTGWRRGPSVLEIVSPIQHPLRCLTLPHSPPADVEAEIVDVGDGSPQEFAARAAELAGRFAMTTSVTYPRESKRWIHRNEKYGRALLAGAAGFLFVNHYPGYGPVTGSIGPDEPTCGVAAIPGVSISKEDGEFLRRLLQRHGQVRLRLRSEDEYFEAISWNVIGELPGTADHAEIVMLGCHYDGHDIAQGAADPASGTTALMEAARVLAQYTSPLPHTIRFAFWSAEEIGLLGSTQYVLQHDGELNRVRFYLNMDMAGAIDSKDIILNEWPELVSQMRDYRDQMALDFGVGQSLSAHSDHFPFMLAGVPTGAIGSLVPSTGGRGYGHTLHDTVDKVTLRGMREAAALSARLALRMADTPTWPVSRRSKAAVAEVLDRPEYREEQELNMRVREFYEEFNAG